MIIRYEVPKNWIWYDLHELLSDLIQAKSAVLALTQIPYQRSWADELQRIQLKREVAGTSRIEGADFTERELDAAMMETPEQLETRSQKQAAAAVSTYRWIAQLPQDRPIDERLICDVHKRLVSDCDSDHCPPGVIRNRDQNVTFGAPRHRGAEGGDECANAFRLLCKALNTDFRAHDPLIQALALHYQFAAMHPFLDGNGRTARALEALMLQRTGLRDTLFIAMSNYYYEEKNAYLNALNKTRESNHNLTAFLKFSLKGIDIQCRRLFSEIKTQVSKALFRNTATDLFGRLKSPKRRVISGRHMELINILIDKQDIMLSSLIQITRHIYSVKNPTKALIRDLNYLIRLGAIHHKQMEDKTEHKLSLNIEWPTQITDTKFFKLVKDMPKGKVYSFLSK